MVSKICFRIKPSCAFEQFKEISLWGLEDLYTPGVSE